MRLSDIMSGADLTVFPEVGLIIFLLVFASIVWRVCFRAHSRDLEIHARLPFNDHSTHQQFQSSMRDSHEPA